MAESNEYNINIGDKGEKEEDKSSGSASFQFDDKVRYTNDDLKRNQERLELELREEKADSQKMMAWVALVFLILVACVLFMPFIPDSRIIAVADLLGLFFVSLAGVVGAYMGFTSWMGRK
jgi:hypothetical protein